MSGPLHILPFFPMSSMHKLVNYMFLLSVQRWTETYVKWSPHGTYLTTFHNQGVALWGASEFVRCGRFTHTQVQLVDFSPDEK